MPVARASVTGPAVVIGGILLALALVDRWNSGEGDREVRKAYGLVTNEVARHLKSPASARFSSFEEARVGNDSDAPRFHGHVDSQNSFGALLRSEFEAEVRGGYVRRLRITEASGEVAVNVER